MNYIPQVGWTVRTVVDGRGGIVTALQTDRASVDWGNGPVWYPLDAFVYGERSTHYVETRS